MGIIEEIEFQSHPQLVFGTAFVGEQFASTGQVSELLETLRTAGVTRIDTAARYPPTKPGMSETLLGKSGVANDEFTVDTKIAIHGMSTAGSLSKANIEKSVKESYERLGVKKINVLYCHAPDFETPLEETAATLDKLYKEGSFNQLGLSHFPVEMVKDYIRICDENGYIKPSVYQGHYNAFSREDEVELLPVLRKHRISYAAHSVLAGGFLTGKLSGGEQLDEGSRFDKNNLAGAAFQQQYDTAPMHCAMLAVQDAITECDLSNAEAALRWAAYHSALKPNDLIILGGSKVAHAKQNIQYLDEGPLPQDVVDALETAWRALSNCRRASTSPQR